MAGLNNISGGYIVIMDDDFQNPISEVVQLISYASENDYDVVYTYYKKKKHSIYRNLGSRFNDKMANIMPNADRNSQTTLYIYSGYPIRSNGLTILDIKFLEWAEIRFK